MAKGWTQFATINKLEPADPAFIKRSDKRFESVMRSMKTPSTFDLKKEAEIADEVRKQKNRFLMEGYKDKKLKSKKLIKQAQSMFKDNKDKDKDKN